MCCGQQRRGVRTQHQCSLISQRNKGWETTFEFFFWQPVEITRRGEFSQSCLARHKVIKPVNDAKLPVIGDEWRNESCSSLRRRRVRPTKMRLCFSGGVRWGRRAAAGRGALGTLVSRWLWRLLEQGCSGTGLLCVPPTAGQSRKRAALFIGLV